MELKAGYKMTEVGVIPEDWEVKKLGDISIVSSGGTPNRGNATYWNGQIPWITTSLIDFKVITTANEFITEEGLNNSAAKLYRAGTILMAMYGQGKTRGKVAILGIDATTNQACGSVTLDKNILKEYILWNLSSRYEEIRNLSNTGNQENLNGDLIKKILIPIPILKTEQTAIATSLSDADALISGLEKLIAKKRNIKQGAMQKLLQPKEGWEVKRLGDVCEFTSGTAHENFINDQGKYIVVNSKFISTDGEVKKYSKTLFCPAVLNDILIVLSDVPNGKAIAKCFFVKENNLFTVNQRIGIVKPKNIHPKYLFYVINRHKDLLAFDDGSKQTNLRNQDILNLKLVIYRSQIKQIDVEKCLSDIDAELTALETKLEKYRNIKLGMMQNLLTGIIRLV